MFLRCKVRRKDGKQHRYWSVVENTRVGGGRVVQRHVLYLGEINDSQELAWRRSNSGVESLAGLETGACLNVAYGATMPKIIEKGTPMSQVMIVVEFEVKPELVASSST